MLVRTDNIATKAYINGHGGTRSSALNREVAMLFSWAEVHLASIRAEHVAGVNDTSADGLS